MHHDCCALRCVDASSAYAGGCFGRIKPTVNSQTFGSFSGVDTDESVGVSFVELSQLLPAPGKRRKM